MPISWTIAEGVVRLESGDVSFDEWRSAIDGFTKDLHYRAGMGVVHDRRKRTISLSTEEVEARANYLIQRAAILGPTRWAVVVVRDVDYGMGRMEQVLLERAPEIKFRVFRDLVEAEAWVRGPTR